MGEEERAKEFQASSTSQLSLLNAGLRKSVSDGAQTTTRQNSRYSESLLPWLIRRQFSRGRYFRGEIDGHSTTKTTGCIPE